MCGLHTHLPELQQLATQHQPKVIALQEVMSRNTIALHKSLKDYDWKFHHPDNGASRGGCALGILRDTPHKFVKLPHLDIHVVAATVEHPVRATFASVYVPFSSSKRALEEQLNTIVRGLPQPLVLLGDFNAHNPLWGSDHTDERGCAVESFAGDNQLMALNDCTHTRIDLRNGKTSALDLSLVSLSAAYQFQWSISDDCHGSDHFPIFIKRNQHDWSRSKRPRWKYEDANWAGFRDALPPPPKDDLATINQCILTAASANIPRTSARTGPKAVPWWTPEVAKAVRRRRKALRRLRKLDDHSPRKATALIRFQEARHEARKVVQAAKDDCWKEFISNIGPQLPAREIWGRIRCFLGTPSKCITSLISGGVTIEDPQTIAETLADQFHRTSAATSESSRYTPPTDSKQDVTTGINTNFRLDELEWVLRRCRGLSAGPDDIGYPMVKNLPLHFKLSLLNLFNEIYANGTIPTIWKTAIVIPIPKAGKDPRVLGNQRPISLVSCMGKIMEKMANRRLMERLEHLEVFGEEQHAFRSRRGADTYFDSLRSYIQPEIARGRHCEVALLDISKAYDTALRVPVLQSLEKWGITGRMLNYVHSFLEDRQFKVAIGNNFSSPRVQEIGFPQGTVLAVTAFLIRMTNLKSYIPKNIELLLYADDVLLLSRGNRPNQVRARLQRGVSAAEKWATQSGFQLATEKCQIIHLCHRLKHQIQVPIVCNGIPIDVVKYARVLGVTIDSRFNFKKHMANIRLSAESRCQALKILGSRRIGAARRTLINAKAAMVDSIMFYGWGLTSSSSENTKASIEPTFNNAVRAASGAFRSSPTTSLMAEAGILPYSFKEKEVVITRAIQISQHLHLIDTPSPLLEQAKDTLKELCDQELPNIQPELRTGDRSWKNPPPRIDWSISRTVNAGDNRSKVATAFAATAAKYSTHRFIFTDGSVFSSPDFGDHSEVGCGIYSEDLQLRFRLPHQCSIMSAEAYAVWRALDFANIRTVIFSDSMSTLKAVESGRSRHPWVQGIEVGLERTGAILCWIPSHTGIPGNERADQLANEARCLPPSNIPVPAQDAARWTKEMIRAEWELTWRKSGTFCQRAKPSTLPWPDRSSHIEQRTLTRLRIGHTKLTHSCLFTKDRSLSLCSTCGVTLTVAHILTDCRRYAEARNEANLGSDIEGVLHISEEDKLVKFLHLSKLLYLI